MSRFSKFFFCRMLASPMLLFRLTKSCEMRSTFEKSSISLSYAVVYKQSRTDYGSATDRLSNMQLLLHYCTVLTDCYKLTSDQTVSLEIFSDVNVYF